MFKFGDEKVIIKHNGKNYTCKEIKTLVLKRADFFSKNPCKNLLLYGENNFEFIINFLGGVYAGKEIFLLTDPDKLNLISGDYITHYENSDELYPQIEIDPNNVFINLFTSGSTSTPKKVRKSLQNLIYEAEDMNNLFPMEKDTIFLTTTKLSHMYGLVFAFVYPFINGYVINTDTIKFPEQITDKKFAFISTPSFLDRMAKYDINPAPPLYIFSAGDKLKQETQKYFENNSKVIDIYGSTETSTVGYKTNSKEKYLTTLPDVEIRKDSENQLCVKSKYFLENEITLNDIVEIIDNKFQIICRSDRVLKIQEKRISAVELESILNKNEYVEDSYCFKFKEKTAAIIILNYQGKEFLLNNGNAELIKMLKQHTSQYSEIFPQKWRFLNEIPKTQTGKVDKELIQKIFGLNLSMPFVLNMKTTSNVTEIKLTFLQHSNFFKGHFPNLPILAGVVQLYFAHFFAENCFKNKISQNKIKKVKFSKIIKPNEIVNLTLTNNPLSVDYRYTDGENIFSSGTFIK